MTPDRIALAEELKAAFHDDMSIPRKNIALRKAYDALRSLPDGAALRDGADTLLYLAERLRVSAAEDQMQELQMVMNRVAYSLQAIAAAPPPCSGPVAARLEPLGPCTQAEIDAWIETIDSKNSRLLLMWMDRALKAEEALATAPQGQEMTDETIDRVAHAIIGTMFAPHELPVDDELWHKYRDTARAAIAATSPHQRSEGQP